LLPFIVYSQEIELGWMNSEVFFITTGLDEEEKIHYHAEPIGTRWTAEDTSPPSNFTITTDYGEGWYPEINEPGIGNVDPEDPFNYYRDCNGFDFVNATPYYNDYILSYGIYKISISESGRDAYFYLDYRDTKYRDYPLNDCHPIDIFFIYDGINDKFGYLCKGPDITSDPALFNDIAIGEYLTIWEIKEQSLSLSPATSDFEDYWENCLAAIKDGNHPRLVWGPLPGFSNNYYKIYKKKSTPGFILYDSTTSLIYTDVNEVILTGAQQGNEGQIHYKITSVGYPTANPLLPPTESDFSNTVTVDRILLPDIDKLGGNNSTNNSENILFQNYPNPFNPTTMISFSIAKDDFVTLRFLIF
jgi:hypothetical protein